MFFVIASDAQAATDFVAKQLGLTQGDANVRTVTVGDPGTIAVELHGNPVFVSAK